MQEKVTGRGGRKEKEKEKEKIRPLLVQMRLAKQEELAAIAEDISTRANHRRLNLGIRN